MSSVTAAVTSFALVTGGRPSAKVRVASAFSVVRPSPRALGRRYSGLRRTVYRALRTSNSSSTKVGVPGSAYLLRSIPPSRTPPLERSYKA